MIGTDLGEEFDDNFVFPTGMVLVLEPVVWEDGTGGYRSEEIVVITEDGFTPLTDYPYALRPLWRLRSCPTSGRCERSARTRTGTDGGPRPRRAGRSVGRPTSGTSPGRRSCGSRAPGRSAPICTVVRSTGEIHLNSTWDEGIPDDIPHDHLYGLAWNPMTLIEVLKGIDGAASRPPGRNRRAHTVLRQAAADGVPQRRDRRRGAGDASGAADQDRRRSRVVLRRASSVAENSLAVAVGELRRGDHRTGADRGDARGAGRGRREHTRNPGRCLGHVAGTSVATGPQRRADRDAVTSWPSPPACWRTATSARLGGRWPVGDVENPAANALYSALE